MDALKRALENIRRMWGNLTATQRVILGAAAVTMVLLVVWGSVGATSVAWVKVVGREVDESTRAKVLTRLQQGQRHEIREKEIYVPKEDADRIMLELAGEGVLSDDAVWKFLEQDSIIASKWDKEMRYQIALQRRLEGMIRRIDGVRNAAVLINPGSKSAQLGFAGPKPSASVQVELHSGSVLSRANAKAIASLVAKAVPGVEVDQVVVADTQGNVHRVHADGNTIGNAADKRALEMEIEKDIQGRIKEYFRTAMVVVRVLTRNKDIKMREIKRDRPTPVEEQENRRVEKSGGTGAVPGIKGEGSVTQVPEAVSGKNETEQESHVKNQFRDEQEISTIDPAGDISRITIGVLIPIEEKDMADAEKQLPKYKEWVMMAGGPQVVDKDVSVQLIPSRKPADVVTAPAIERGWEWISAHWAKLLLFALAFIGLVIMILVIRGALSRDTVEELQDITLAIREGVEAGQAAESEIVLPAEGESGRYRQGIREMIGKNPQNVAGSLKAFMSGK